ncbi:hypothetical protein T4D_16150 [Trichinella pseudospiralis]|uniref:Uncharacterized protein n=1 Tax=Trichinella pseudospiralis TaxID=6337 RepID=A0A0V1FNE5_TRIPS|nr:hypothetical protein T4D_16150 [Trichinella pseudospiralis]
MFPYCSAVHAGMHWKVMPLRLLKKTTSMQDYARSVHRAVFHHPPLRKKRGKFFFENTLKKKLSRKMDHMRQIAETYAALDQPTSDQHMAVQRLVIIVAVTMKRKVENN